MTDVAAVSPTAASAHWKRCIRILCLSGRILMRPSDPGLRNAVASHLVMIWSDVRHERTNSPVHESAFVGDRGVFLTRGDAHCGPGDEHFGPVRADRQRGSV